MTQSEFETQLKEAQAWAAQVCGSTGTDASRVETPKFNVSTSWAVFCFQFEAIVEFCKWAPCMKSCTWLLHWRLGLLLSYMMYLEELHNKEIIPATRLLWGPAPGRSVSQSVEDSTTHWRVPVSLHHHWKSDPPCLSCTTQELCR
jgi:hypothetical protein